MKRPAAPTPAVSKASAFLLATACTLAVAPHSFGQPAPTASSEAKSTTPASAATPTTDEVTSENNDVVVMDPFVVDASKDKGYQVNNTLAGTRIRTELKDIASSISVVNAEFLRDTGAKNQQDLLVYTTNTEVGGVQGNMAGIGGTFINGANEGGTNNFLRPNQNTRVRGLDSADNTRDFFLTDLPWDAYIVDRVDLQRGPNSILFGLGSPAGIVNSSVNTAGYKTGGKIENRLGSFGSLRFSLDYNHVLLEDELSVRVAALDDDQKYRQNPAFNHDKRIFGALRFDPKALAQGSARTSVRANYEHGEVRSNRPRSTPPQDRITPFFDSSAIGRKVFDPFYVWQTGQIGYPNATAGTPNPSGVIKNYWLVQYMGPGLQVTANPILTFDGANSVSVSSAYSGGPTTYFGLKSDGTIDAAIDGFPYSSNIGIAGYSEMANSYMRDHPVDNPATPVNEVTLFAAADKGFYKDRSLTDTSIFDFYNTLIDGPNKREWQNWDAFNVAVSQTLLNNRIAVELVYDRQKYNDGQTRNVNNPYISVDIRSHLNYYPSYAYPDLAKVNPNAGKAFVGSSGKNYGNSSNFTDRENFRATLTGELRADDLLDKGFLSRLLGRHIFTGLYSKENYERENRQWVRYAVDNSWSTKTGNPNGGLANGDIVIDWITYLSGDLRTKTSASGLNLPGITAVQSPKGTFGIDYYDSHWKMGTSVNPADAWLNPSRTFWNGTGGEPTTQSENVRNYVGWTNANFGVLNADEGDLNRLYTDVSRIQIKNEAKGVTWQGFFWDDILVTTFGARRDTQKTRAGNSAAVQGSTVTASPNPELAPLDPVNGVSTGNSVSWGVVLHTPKQIRDRLPWGTNVSLSYSDGRNARVETRYDFNGAPLPNSKGRTKDIGIALRTLDDRLQFKATIYKTTVTDANLSSVTTEVSTLGSNTYYVRNLEAWGTASALLDLAGRAGGANGWEWYWNWALVDSGWDGTYNDPNGAAFKNHPSTIKQTAAINSWLSQIYPQAWWDAYGFPVNAAKAKAGDWAGAIAGWTPTAGVGGVQPAGGGRINGVFPTGTANNESKGVEYEIVGEPIKGLTVSINASKTKASQTALGQSLVNFIEAQHAKYMTAAGDLRLWWGGDATVREYYNNNIWSAYQFQVQTNGKMVAEMAPWRFNLVSNYSFQSGRLKGANIGIGYRWQDGVILGYGLNAAKDNLDVEKPIWGKSDDALDLWAGYEFKLTEKFRWRVQLNLRNIAQDPKLRPISVQPDGSPAGFRIQEGMTWNLTNTLSF